MVTEQQIETWVEAANDLLSEQGKNWRVKYAPRHGWAVIDMVGADGGQIKDTLKSGTKDGVYSYLCGMVRAMRD